MFSPSSLLLVHLVGLAMGLGAATAKLVLLFQCRADGTFVPTYLAVVRPITRQVCSTAYRRRAPVDRRLQKIERALH